MSHLAAFISALPAILSAARRPLPRPLETPLIDAPFTRSALTEATASWQSAARRHAEAREAHLVEVVRFLREVSSSDDYLARGWQ